MKTKNNVQKSVVRSLAVLAVSVLMCTNSPAQDSKTRTIEPENQALAMAAKSETKKAKMSEKQSAALLTAVAEAEQEKPLEIENWMTNEKLFTPSGLKETGSENQVKAEDEIANNLNNETNPATAKKEVKERKIAMIIENSNNKYGRRLFVIFEEDVEQDLKLEIESWMVDRRIWNRN